MKKYINYYTFKIGHRGWGKYRLAVENKKSIAVKTQNGVAYVTPTPSLGVELNYHCACQFQKFSSFFHPLGPTGAVNPLNKILAPPLIGRKFVNQKCIFKIHANVYKKSFTAKV